MDTSATQYLQSLALRALVVAPVRIVLALIGVAAAIAAGSPRPGALLAFLTAAVGLVIVIAADPRRHVFRIPDDPPDADPEAIEDGVARLALAAVFPSTVGVTVLLLAALAFEPTLSAVLSGILAGLGVAALVNGVDQLLAERRTGLRLFLVRGTQQVVGRHLP